MSGPQKIPKRYWRRWLKRVFSSVVLAAPKEAVTRTAAPAIVHRVNKYSGLSAQEATERLRHVIEGGLTEIDASGELVMKSSVVIGQSPDYYVNRRNGRVFHDAYTNVSGDAIDGGIVKRERD